MTPDLFDQYRQTLEQRFSNEGHANLAHYFTADLAASMYTIFHRRHIESLSAYLPYNQRLFENPYLLQGGGDYHILEVNFTNGQKAIIHTHHIYKHTATLPMPQKHGNLVDLMIRLHYLRTLSTYIGTQTFMVLVSDQVMINYMNGFAFEAKQITPAWVANQANAFQQAIIRRFRDHLQSTGEITASQYTPVYTNSNHSFGMGVWQII